MIEYLLKGIVPLSLQIELRVLSYRTMIVLGLYVGIVLVYRRMKAANIPPSRARALFILSALTFLPAGLVSSWLPDMFYYPTEHWSLAFFLKRMSLHTSKTFHTSLIVPIAIAMLYVKALKLPFARTWDTIFLYIPLSLGIGRIGCWLSGCCWGRETTVSLMGSIYTFHHPVPLYELAADLLVFFIGKRIYYRVYSGETGSADRLFGGAVVASYLIGYGVLRFFLEMIRVNPDLAWGMTQAQWAMVASIFIGVLIIVSVKTKNRSAKEDR